MVAVIKVVDDGVVPEKPKRKMRVSRAQAREVNEQLKQDVLNLVAQGASPKTAYEYVGRSLTWYQSRRRHDKAWAALVDRARRQDGPDEASRTAAAGSFEQFCGEYLDSRLFDHQRLWIDLIEGSVPETIHPSMLFESGSPDHIMINVPPDHAKSTTITVQYVTYRICKDPNVRIVIVSKTLEMARQFCYAVKQRLTHPRYHKLQTAFGPPGGFQATADQWTATTITLDRDSGEKDPTLRCIGVGQQIYGARLDLCILDDVVTTQNAHEFEKQIHWIRHDILSRPGDQCGTVLIVGTRVAPQDLYSQIRDPGRYVDNKSPWTYLACPAVLDFAEDPKDWVTLWPRSDQQWPGKKDPPGPDGLYARWDGPALARRRAVVGTAAWAFCYQQQNLSEDAVFPAPLVKAAINGMRSPGLLYAGGAGHRPKGMDGLYVVGGVDPAMVGDTGIVVIGLDRFTARRYVLDVRVKTSASPTWMRETIKQMTAELGVHEWRIEKNAFQLFLTQDPELRQHLSSLGVIITEHFTGKGKWDTDYGVAAMSLLFQNKLIELPSTHKSEATRQLVEQLITWAPEVSKHQKTDLVMALWFAEIKCKEIVQANSAGEMLRGFLPNPFLSRARKARQHVVNLADLAALTEVG